MLKLKNQKMHKLPFKIDGEEITLLIRLTDESARLSILDACAAGSFESMQRAVMPLVCGWLGVCREDGTTPVLFDVTDDAGKVTGENRLGDLLQSVSLSGQLEITAGLLSFIGLAKYAEQVIAVAHRFTGKSVDLRPTEPPASEPSEIKSPG